MINIIDEIIKKIKIISIKKMKSDMFFFILLLVFSTSCAYFLGKISVYEEIRQKKYEKSIFFQKTTEQNNIIFVASKNGKVFYFPWCSGAMRLKEKNKIFFNSKEEAVNSNYRPAKNCGGL